MPTPEQQKKLDAYIALLLKWNAKINLISRSSINEVHERHIADSLQLVDYISENVKTIIDIGSGGGLPAIPLAIITGLPVHMVESDKRKCAFLRQAMRELGLEGKVYDARIDEAELEKIEEPALITSRALSELKNICNWVNSLVAKNNLKDYALLLLKGENVSRETIAAKQEWDLDLEFFESKTSSLSKVLRINKFGAKNGGNN